MTISLRALRYRRAHLASSSAAFAADAIHRQRRSPQSAPHPRTRPATTTFFRRHGPLVRADRRGPAGRQVVGQRLSPRHQLRPGVHERRRFRRHVRLRPQGPRRDLRLVPVRHAHRPRPAAAVHAATRRSGGIVDRYPLAIARLDRRQYRRLLRSARRSTSSRSIASSRRRSPSAAIVKAPTGDKDAGVRRASPTSRSISSSARRRRALRGVGVRRL